MYRFGSKQFGRVLMLAMASLVAAVIMTGAFPALAHADVAWKRLAGPDAFGTMQAVVQEGWQTSETVVIATFDGYWDALAASALAGAEGAPVLLSQKDALSPATTSEIQRLGAKRAIVCGGTAALTEAVEAQLANLGLQVERLQGLTAIDTAIAIAGAVQQPSDTCIVATVNGYWDALAASPYSYAKKAPVFLTEPSGIMGQATLDAIKQGGFKRAVVAGGTAAVSDQAVSQLQGLGMDVQRVGGATAYHTAVDLADFAVREGMVASNLGIATANGFHDALTGAALCGKSNAVLLLADAAYYAAPRNFVYAQRAGMSAGRVFGGPVAVGEKVFDQMKDITRSAWVPPFGSTERAALNISEDYRSAFYHGTKTAEHQKYIMLHDTEGDGSAANTIAWWAMSGQRVAAHFVINKNGSIVQCVPLDVIAHHAGFGNTGHNARFGVTDESRDDKVGTVPIGAQAADYGMNSYSVGIEMVHVGGSGYYPEAQLNALDKLIAYIDAYYGAESTIIDHKAWRIGNSDTSPEFAGYLANYQAYRHH